MAHRLISNRSKKCMAPHGHNEYVKVKIQSKQEKRLDGEVNMVETFEKIKKTWHRFIDHQIDHSFQLGKEDPLIDFFKQHEPDKLEQIVVTPGDPTTEMMCACLMSKLQTFLNAENDTLFCQEMSIEETPTNRVSLIGMNAFKKHLPEKEIDVWWMRNDHSINDF